jgi:Tol biopolymer transport system component
MFQLPPPKSVTAPNIYYVSPDGRRFVTDWTDANNVPSLWVRRADSVTLARLPGTEGASWPFWSPDGEHVAYEQSGALWTMWANGGPAVRVCDGVRGMGSWGKNGTILLASKEDGPIQMVNSSGGHPTSVTHLDKGRKETKHFWPHFLPDGVHFLFLAKVTGEDEFLLCAASIRGGRTRIVGRTQSRVEFASGRILYVRGGTLFARPFDVRSLKFTGDPSAIVENVEYFPNIGYARFSSSPATLVYRASGVIPNAHLLWVDRQGFTTKEVAGRGLYLSPAVSPDGTELSAVVAVDSTTYTRDIWTWDLSRTLGARTTFTNSYMGCNVWAADGRHILYSSRDSLRLVSTERPDIDTVLTPLDGCPYSWTRDGRWIAFTRWGERDQDVYAISLGDRGREVPIAKTPQAEVDPALTPDGRFVAYAGAESGQLEIFVQAFPSGQPRWRVSTSGGQEPFWRQDGRELFYLSPQRELMAVAVGPGLKPQFGTPHKLFDAPVVLRVASRNSYAPAPDGQHFLIVAAEREWTGASTVVVNWSSGLEP